MGTDSSALFSNGEPSSRVLCPVLDTTFPESRGQLGKSQEESDRTDYMSRKHD